MIASDQPDCFPPYVLVAVSSREDGTMLDRTANQRHQPSVVENRKKFCLNAGIPYEACVYQIISYEPDATYRTIQEVTRPNTNGVYADALYTEVPGVGMFLPVADCVPTVLYDLKKHSLALAHMGRHASIAKTIAKTVEYMVKRGSNPADIRIWMGPSVAKQNYVLEYFDHMADDDWKPYARIEQDGIHLDLAGFNTALAIKAGVPAENIVASAINTAKDTHYFSHSQGDTNGRFATVVMLGTKFE